MKITREVITDLLPVYFSDEASKDTQALVEAFFEEDPEFARLARAKIDDLVEQLDTAPNLENDEMLSLRKTKQLLRLRSTLMGFAICFTVFPFSVYDTSKTDGMKWFFAEHPTTAAVFVCMAALCWTGYAVLRHRVRTSEL